MKNKARKTLFFVEVDEANLGSGKYNDSLWENFQYLYRNNPVKFAQIT